MKVAALLLSVAFAQEPTPTPLENGSHAPSPGVARTEDGRVVPTPKKIKHVDLKYPEKASRVGLNGVVIMDCTITPTGEIGNIEVLRGYKILSEAAVKSVSKWRYTPTVIDGVAVRVRMTMTAHFQKGTQPFRADLLRLVRDDDPEIRWAAVRWLGRYRPTTKDQRAALERATKDSSELVRTEAMEALDRLEVVK